MSMDPVYVDTTPCSAQCLSDIFTFDYVLRELIEAKALDAGDSTVCIFRLQFYDRVDTFYSIPTLLPTDHVHILL